jgi:hypothetical protein
VSQYLSYVGAATLTGQVIGYVSVDSLRKMLNNTSERHGRESEFLKPTRSPMGDAQSIRNMYDRLSPDCKPHRRTWETCPHGQYPRALAVQPKQDRSAKIHVPVLPRLVAQMVRRSHIDQTLGHVSLLCKSNFCIPSSEMRLVLRLYRTKEYSCRCRIVHFV